MRLFIPHVTFWQVLCLFGPPDASLPLTNEQKIQLIAFLETGPAVFSIYPSWAAAVVCCTYYWFLHPPMLKTVNIFHSKFKIPYYTPWETGFPTLSSAPTCPGTTSKQNWKEPGFPAWAVNGNIQHLMYSRVFINDFSDMTVSLLLPELLWPVTTYFQTSVNNILNSH